jgi:hypothetical protein
MGGVTMTKMLLETALLGELDDDTITWLIDNSEEDERFRLLKDTPHIPQNTLLRYAGSGEINLRYAVSCRSDLDGAARTVLQKDRSDRVARAAGAVRKGVKGKNASKETMKEAIKALKELDFESWTDVEALLASPALYPYLKETDLADTALELWVNHPAKRETLLTHFRTWFKSGQFTPQVVGEAIYELCDETVTIDDGLLTSSLFSQRFYDEELYPDAVPKEWLDGADWMLGQLAALHPALSRKDYTNMLKADDTELSTMALHNRRTTRKDILLWAKNLTEYPDAGCLPTFDAETIEEMHNQGEISTLRVLSALGKLTGDEVTEVLKSGDNYFARDVLNSKAVTRKHLLIAAESSDYYIGRKAIEHAKSNTDVLLTYATHHPRDVDEDLVVKIPEGRTLELPLSSLLYLASNIAARGNPEARVRYETFQNAIMDLVKAHGPKALTLLNGFETSNLSAAEAINATWDTLKT